MGIINNQNYITDKQLNKIIKLLGNKYKPFKLIIIENRSNLITVFKHSDIVSCVYSLLNIFVWLGKIEGIYNIVTDTVIVYVFSENDDGEDIQSKQLYSLHALLHELRHRWQKKTKYKNNEENDADEFATKFINKNSKIISKIMNWNDEWEVEEE